jgi:hypothetical protein
MLKLINSIGQRKVSKLLFYASIAIAISCFLINAGPLTLAHPLTWLGVFLMSAPIGFLSWGAHKTKDYRMLCLVSEATLIVMNSLLYFMNIPEFFFILTILETFATFGFSILFTKKKPAKVMVKRKRSSTTKVVTEDPQTNE